MSRYLERFSLRLSFCMLLCYIVTMTTAELKQGQKCPNLNETLTYQGDGEHLDDVYQKLVSCPNITALHLDLGTSGCVVTDFDWAFQFREGDRFPALKKLSLSGYDFAGTGNWRSKNWSWKLSKSWLLNPIYKIQELVGQVLPDWAPKDLPKPAESNLDQWLRAMDFSQLSDLTFHYEHGSNLFIKTMVDKLPGLRSLKLFWNDTGTSIPQPRMDFLNSVPSLQNLSILIDAPYQYMPDKLSLVRTPFPLSDILATHGPTLTHLSLHQRESQLSHLRRPMLSIEQIDSVRTSCSIITHLGLDIDRNGTYPYENLHALMSIPTLTSVTIGLEIGADLHVGESGEYGWNPAGLKGDGPWREPRMSKIAAHELFEELRVMKKGEGLRRAEFVVGDYSEAVYQGPLYLPDWVEGRARKFICEAEKECVIIGEEDLDPWIDEVTETVGLSKSTGGVGVADEDFVRPGMEL